MKNFILVSFAAVVLLGGLAGCQKVEPDVDPVAETANAGESNLADTVAGLPDLSKSAALVKAAGLAGMLEGDAAYTLFLPSDDALSVIPTDQLGQLQTEEARAELIALLRQHIVPGALAKSDIEAAMEQGNGSVSLATMAERNITLIKSDEKIRIGDGDDAPALTGTAAAASNGVVYIIDGVIAP